MQEEFQNELQMNREPATCPERSKTLLSRPWFLRGMILLCVILFAALAWRLISLQHHADGLVSVRELRFQTKEDVVEHFFKGIAKGDTENILEAWAVSGMPNTNFEYYLEHYKNLDHYVPDWTVSYDMYRSFDELLSLYSISDQLKGFISSLLIPWQDYRNYSQADPSGTVSRLNPYFLKNIQLINLIDAASLTESEYDRQSLSKNYEQLKTKYHAEDASRSLAVFTLDKQYYTVGFTLIKRQGSWRIQSFEAVDPSDVLDITGTGLHSESYRARPLTPGAYQNILDDLAEGEEEDQ